MALLPAFREGIFIIDVASNDEVGKLLRELPFWGNIKWSVTPLQSIRPAIEQDRATIQQMKAMLAGQR